MSAREMESIRSRNGAVARRADQPRDARLTRSNMCKPERKKPAAGRESQHVTAGRAGTAHQSRTTTSRSVPDSARPHFAGPAEDLAHIGARFVTDESLEFFGRRIEAVDGVGRPIADPDLVLVVDIDGVAAVLALRQRPHLPRLVERIVAADFAAVPEAHPQQALGIRPDAARTDARLRRRDHQRVAADRVDPGDVIAGERGVPDFALRRRGDAVGADALRRLPRINLAGRRIDTAIETVLAGEPEDALAIEGRGVEVGVGGLLAAADTASRHASPGRRGPSRSVHHR